MWPVSEYYSPEVCLHMSCFLFLSSLPKDSQDFWRGMAGQTAEEDVGHESQPSRGLLSQVGLWKGPMEMKTGGWMVCGGGGAVFGPVTPEHQSWFCQAAAEVKMLKTTIKTNNSSSLLCATSVSAASSVSIQYFNKVSLSLSCDGICYCLTHNFFSICMHCIKYKNMKYP